MKQLIKFSINLIVLLLLVTSCEETIWLEKPPNRFIDKWVQYGEPFYGEIPAEFSIDENLVVYKPLYFEGDEVSERILSIRKVRKSGNEIVIFCGEKNDQYIAESRFKVQYNSDSTISIFQIVPTGVNQNTETFFIGSFKKK